MKKYNNDEYEYSHNSKPICFYFSNNKQDFVNKTEELYFDNYENFIDPFSLQSSIKYKLRGWASINPDAENLYMRLEAESLNIIIELDIDDLKSWKKLDDYADYFSRTLTTRLYEKVFDLALTKK